MPLCGEEGEAHTTTDEQPIDLRQQRLMTASLSDTFDPPSTTA